MASEDVAGLLAKDFVTLKIDEDRTLGGKALHEKLRAGRQGGLPWFVFLDAEGKELAAANDLDGGGGNVGFPQTDAEVAWFGKALTAARATISDEEIAALKASLVKVREEREKAAREAAERKQREAGG
jgi:hypothetical protein